MVRSIGKGKTFAPPNGLRTRDGKGKTIVVCIRGKSSILKELDNLGINEETMFPEIKDVIKSIVKRLTAD